MFRPAWLFSCTLLENTLHPDAFQRLHLFHYGDLSYGTEHSKGVSDILICIFYSYLLFPTSYSFKIIVLSDTFLQNTASEYLAVVSDCQRDESLVSRLLYHYVL